MKFLDRLHPLALLALRVGLGIIMISHGAQKVFGGMPNAIAMVAKLGLPGWMAYLSAAAEFGGGILLVTGLLTRLAALSVGVDMAVAIAKYHWVNGLRGAPGKPGYEFPLACGVIAFALIFLGAGPISLDGAFFRGGGSSPARK
ncbi:MAG TPA: DoxX family protein [Terriglobales bacterium]|nr:DoxX family protein [Terriglobales bacterium]